MSKYLKAIFNIFKNYQFYSFQVLFYEFIFFIFYNHKFNRFKYLNSNFLSDSIPCPFLFLIKINKFISNNNVKHICDLGSGYGKILYFFGILKKLKIDGVEFDIEIFNSSYSLQNNNINIFNDDILKFDFEKKNYDLLIINDPLKDKEDFRKLILKIKMIKKDMFIIFINLDFKKKDIMFNSFKILDKFEPSNNKNIFYCK
jgi:hypothetical protein